MLKITKQIQSSMFKCTHRSCGALTPKKVGHCTFCHKDGHWKDHYDRRTGDRTTLCPELKKIKRERRQSIRNYNAFASKHDENKCVVVHHNKTDMQIQMEQMKNIAVTKMASMAMKRMFGLIISNWQDENKFNNNLETKLFDCGMFVTTRKKKGKKGKK